MTDDDRQIRSRCTRFLSHHRPVRPADMLQRLAAHEAAAAAPDAYGTGGAVQMLEERVSAMLGKERGLFFIKGVTAQLCVLSAQAAIRRCRTVALHPLGHLDRDEQNAVERVAGLVALRLGREAPFTVEALRAVREPIGMVVVELPLRRAGYLLPDLAELEAIAAWCRDAGVPLHLDGARIWEAAAGYDVPLAELCALADSVYVSFYKGLGGLGGALVAGSEALIAALRPWKTRYGGDLYTAYPQAISALDGLDRHLPAMPLYVERARALAERLVGTPGLLLQPTRPHVNAFQIWFEGTPDELAARHRAFAAERGIWLFNGFEPTALGSHAMAEVVIGDASGDHSADEAAAWLRDFAGG